MDNPIIIPFEPFLRTLSDAPNERWYNNQREFDKVIVRHTPAVLGIEPIYPVFREKLDMADALLEQVSKSWLTGKLKTKDAERDTTTKGFVAAVRALLKSPFQKKREAAEKIIITCDGYGDITKLEYDAQTAATFNFIQDMEGKHLQDIIDAELTDWIPELKRLNTEFDNTVGDRYAEKADRPAEKLSAVRRETDIAISNICKVIEAAMIISPKPELDRFVTEMNVVINHYRTIAAQAKGRRNAKKTDPEVNTEGEE
jgi:antirestriction protein